MKDSIKAIETNIEKLKKEILDFVESFPGGYPNLSNEMNYKNSTLKDQIQRIKKNSLSLDKILILAHDLNNLRIDGIKKS